MPQKQKAKRIFFVKPEATEAQRKEDLVFEQTDEGSSRKTKMKEWIPYSIAFQYHYFPV